MGRLLHYSIIVQDVRMPLHRLDGKHKSMRSAHLQTAGDHAVEGVATAAAHADDLDAGIAANGHIPGPGREAAYAHGAGSERFVRSIPRSRLWLGWRWACAECSLRLV